MLSKRDLHDDKPWNAVIEKIDKALKELKISFDKAFAEGQVVPNPREVIKKALFGQIWGLLAVDRERFAQLSDLDAYYHKIQVDLNKSVGDFVRLAIVKKMCQENAITEPVSARKIEMLSKIIDLYHALARNRFLLTKLNDHYTVEKCQDEMLCLQQQSTVNQDHLSQMDIDHYSAFILNPLKMLNQHLINVMAAKGYGNVVVENLLKPVESSSVNSAVLLPLYTKINTLPKVSELVAAIRGDAPEGSGMRQVDLRQYANSIQDIRQTLIQVCDDVVRKSSEEVDSLALHYDALKEIQQKINNRDDYEAFFRLVLDIKNAQEDSPESANFPVLRHAGRVAMTECDGQSQVEKYSLSIVKNGWGEANQCISVNLIEILNATRAACHPYHECRKSYVEALDTLNKRDGLYDQASKLVADWRLVNAQLQQIVGECDRLMAAAGAVCISAGQTSGQYAASFFKRHWSKMLVGAAVLCVPGIVLPLTIMAPIAAAALVPGGVVIGVASGAGAGLIKDKISPPVAPAVASPLLSMQVQHSVNTAYILERMFGTAEQPVVATNIAPANRRASAPVNVTNVKPVNQQVDRIAVALIEEVDDDELRYPDVPPVSSFSRVSNLWSSALTLTGASQPSLGKSESIKKI